MSASSGEEIVRRWHRLKAERAAFERNWDEIARFMRPFREGFQAPRPPGAQRRYAFDSTPLTAVENFAGGIYGLLTNPAERWFALKLKDDELGQFDPVRDWLYDVETRLLDSFGPQSSRFYAVLPALFADLACFGTAVFYSEEIPGEERINDAVRPLSECAIGENEWGEVDTVYRRFALNGRQALSLFGAGLSPRARRSAERDPYGAIPFIHCVAPSERAEDGGAEDRLALAFRSTYVEEETRHIAGEGGYHEMPYQAPRWAQAAGEVYGRGIGEQVLADVRMLNRLDETNAVMAERLANPPLAAADEGVIKSARTWPGGITYGAIDQNGQLLLRPLFAGGDLSGAQAMIERRRSAVREAFHVSLMQMAALPNMTATEWIGRREEKLRLLGPHLGRIQSEFLSPLIRRRFGLLMRAGRLPPPPLEVQGATLSIDYVSPLARAQMAGEAQAVARLYDALGVVAQADATVLDNLDHDEAAQVLGRGAAVPAKIMRAGDQVGAIRLERAQAQALERGIRLGPAPDDAANGAAGAGADVGQAIELLRQALRGRLSA